MTVQLGLALRAAGLDQVEEHDGGRFVDLMRLVAIRICREKGQVTSDDLRDWALAEGVTPHHPNAWGAIFRGKGWVPVGYRRSRHASNHARTIRVWTYRAGDE